MLGAVGGFIGQNLMMIIGIITGGAALSSVRYIREYERGVVTRFGKLVRLPNPPPNSDGVKEYSGFVFRIPGLYRVEVVNIRDRTDMLSVDGIERPDKVRGGTAKWRMALTAKWNVAEGYVYSGSKWQIEDLGEFVRGKIESGLSAYMQAVDVSNVHDSAKVYAHTVDRVRDDLLQHGVVWSDLMLKEFARTDSEVQAQATVDGANILAAAIRSASQQAHP